MPLPDHLIDALDRIYRHSGRYAIYWTKVLVRFMVIGRVCRVAVPGAVQQFQPGCAGCQLPRVDTLQPANPGSYA